MEQLACGLTLEVPPGAFPLSTDSMVLSHFVKLPGKARVLDLGSGCGTLGLLLCARSQDCRVTGLEIDPTAHQGAILNIERNGLADRMASICADLRCLSQHITPGSMDICVSNPPYFSCGPRSAAHGDARREDSCSLEDLTAAAAKALKYGGDFFLVHRPERLAEICSLGASHGMEAKRLCLVRHKKDGPVTLILLQLRKGGKPCLLWEELYLQEPDGSPSAAYKHIYHL
jgi:tRNA1(Val) A37 N6-methylase TrmN6